MTHAYTLGPDIAPIATDDWEPINASPPETLAVNGICAWSDWSFSQKCLAFRQCGGNSQGDTWERYYRALRRGCDADALPYPCHVADEVSRRIEDREPTKYNNDDYTDDEYGN